MACGATIAHHARLVRNNDGIDRKLRVSRRCTRIPIIQKWRGVIQNWEARCPEKNLFIPLRSWPSTARTSEFKSKYHVRKIVAEKST